MRRFIFVLLSILYFNVLPSINLGDNPKTLIPVPSPTYQKIHIRAYSVDTLNGKIYVAGKFSSFDGQSKQNLVRLNLADGSVDNAWNPKCSGDVMDILYDNGKVFIIGNLDTINGVPDRYAACIDVNGNFLWTRGNNDPTFWNNSLDNKFVVEGKPFLLLSANDIVAVNISASDSFLATPTSTTYAIITQQYKATAIDKNTGSLVQTNNFANAYNLMWDNISASATKLYTASNYTKLNNKDYFSLKFNDYVIGSYDGVNAINSPTLSLASDIVYIDTIANKLRCFLKTNYDFFNTIGFTDTSAVCLFNLNTLSPIALNSVTNPENYYYKAQGFVPIYIDPITSGPSSYTNYNLLTYAITSDKRNNRFYLGMNRQGLKGINTYVAYVNNVVEPALGTTLNMRLSSQYHDTLSQIADTSIYNIKSMEPRALKVIQNKLINISSAHPAINDTIDYINAYCLYTDAPKITNFNFSSVPVGQTPTITVCANNSKKIVFQKLPYLANRAQTYTGVNVSFAYSSFDTLVVNASTSATSGFLKMVSVSDCGRLSDTLKVYLTILPQPNAVASSPIPTISCFYRKAPIKGSSITPNVSYSWIGPAGYTSPFQNDSTAYRVAGKYVVTVTNTITGCSKKDSVNISIDTLRPTVVLPTIPVNLYCSPDSSLLNGSSPSPNPNIWWHIANSGIKYTNPYYTKNIGNYYMVVQNMTNGCKDSSAFVVGDKRVLPNSKITSHSFVPAPLRIDSITCINPSVTVTGASDTLNTIITWKDLATNTILTNPFTTTSQGNFTLRIKRTDNGCADSSKTIYINQNITQPNLSVVTPTASINCSSSTATLNANSLTGSATLSWSGPSSFTSSNPAVTSQQGKYYIIATDASNGCTKKDSAIVNYTPSLTVKVSNDTLVCKNSPVTLNASSIGTVTGVTYSWNNGSAGQSISVNPTLTGNYIVTANAPNGCAGKDTMRITVPADIKDSIVTTKNCNGSAAGSIAVFVKGGIAPYLISFNGAAYSSQTTFTNLPYGTYNISIKDSLGCTQFNTATINQNSSLPTPVFIASTQNTKGDTIVLIDLTVPKADSVQWTLSFNATIVGGDMFNPLVFFADTGNYVITLTAFYADCSINTTKTIHVAPIDTTLANALNNNGIKSITLYPNPNTGIFTADVEFYKKQNASVMIIDANSVKHFQQNYLNALMLSVPVDVSNLSNGTYIFKVIGEYNSKHINFVISK